MKKTLLFTAIASVALLSASQLRAQDRLHKIIIESDENFWENDHTLPAANTNLKEITIGQIDSVAFDVNTQLMRVFGSVPGFTPMWADYDLQKLTGFTFSYFNNGECPAPLLCARNLDDNSLEIAWQKIDGASSYEIAYMKQDDRGRFFPLNNDWVRNGHRVTVSDSCRLIIPHLDYDGLYFIAVRALSPKGEAFHSPWTHRHDFRADRFYTAIRMSPRDYVPSLITSLAKDSTEVTIGIDLTVDPAKTYNRRLAVSDGQFVVDQLRIKTSYSERVIPVTSAMKSAGRITVTDLNPGTYYQISLGNSTLPGPDAYYASRYFTTPGDITPILIHHSVADTIWLDPAAESIDPDTEIKWFEAEQEWQACRIDTVISNFNNDLAIPEGQVFYLEGGKTYYLRSSCPLYKGLTLMTDPADLAAGKGRARVLLGGLFRQENSYYLTNNWTIGKVDSYHNDETLYIDRIVFSDIDFDCPMSVNFGLAYTSSLQVTGNYFVNTLASGGDFELESFETRNCTFQGIRRGFFRGVQGTKKRVINHLILDNNVWFNCGFYSSRGVDYQIIYGEQPNTRTNICNDLRITNCTFYDTPMGGISPTKNALNKGFDDDIRWNITVENNTFINHCTRSDAPLLSLRYVPDNSRITFKNNLICLTKDADDNRPLRFCGIDIRNIEGQGNIEFDICNNYSASSEEDHRVDNGIITNSRYRFTGQYGPAQWWSDGADNSKIFGANSLEDLSIKVGATPLKATDIFVDPNPAYHAVTADDVHPDMHAADPETIWSRLTYRNDGTLLDHEIYKLNIGAPRWRSADPKNFVPGN